MASHVTVGAYGGTCNNTRKYKESKDLFGSLSLSPLVTVPEWWGGTKSLTDSLKPCERIKKQKYNYHDMGSAGFGGGSFKA